MCVILACDTVKPDLDTLKKCEEANKDGGGVAWLDKASGLVHWKKGIKAEEIAETIQYVNPPLIVHFRFSTVGGAFPALCHPFPIDDRCSVELEGRTQRVLFHNGHWADWQEAMMTVVLASGKKLPGGAWSDSRALAYIVRHCGRTFLNLVNQTQKVAILSKDGIFLSGFPWTEREGIMYSNLLPFSCGYNYRRGGYWKNGTFHGFEQGA